MSNAEHENECETLRRRSIELVNQSMQIACLLELLAQNGISSSELKPFRIFEGIQKKLDTLAKYVNSELKKCRRMLFLEALAKVYADFHEGRASQAEANKVIEVMVQNFPGKTPRAKDGSRIDPVDLFPVRQEFDEGKGPKDVAANALARAIGISARALYGNAKALRDQPERLVTNLYSEPDLIHNYAAQVLKVSEKNAIAAVKALLNSGESGFGEIKHASEMNFDAAKVECFMAESEDLYLAACARAKVQTSLGKLPAAYGISC